MIFTKGRQLFTDAFEYASFPIDYYRDGELLLNQVKAKIGKNKAETVGEYGASIVDRSVTFIIQDTANIIPMVGDIIVYDDRDYVVCEFGVEPCYRHHVLNESIRIFTKQL